MLTVFVVRHGGCAVKFLTALVAGLLFGAGLLVSGMTDPANVLGFLDIFGEWRPQLAFVMGAAVLTAAPSFWFVRHSRRSAARRAGGFAGSPSNR